MTMRLLGANVLGRLIVSTVAVLAVGLITDWWTPWQYVGYAVVSMAVALGVALASGITSVLND